MLLRALCAATGGFYHQAVEGTAAEQLRDLSEDYSPFARPPAAPAFGDAGGGDFDAWVERGR